jgi:hypothetical protein
VFSQYRWAGRRILSFSGTYRIASDSIYLRISATRELVGGHLRNGGPPFDFGWILEGSKEKEISHPQAPPIPLGLRFRNDDTHRYLVIDDHDYVLVSDDPSKELR